MDFSSGVESLKKPPTKATKDESHKEETPAPNQAQKGPDGKVPPAVQTFHDFFRPIWKIEDKKARMAKFCEQADKALEVTDALEGLKPPEGVSAKAWAQALFELSTHIADSDRACASDKKNFEKYFLGANDSLDALMALTKPGHQGH